MRRNSRHLPVGVLLAVGMALAGEGLGPPVPGVADVAGSGAEGLALGAPEPAPASAFYSPPRPSPVRWRFGIAPGEFRGAWLHWQDYASPAAIARTVARARRCRLNALLPLANYPHQAMWQSRLIPVNPDLAPGFDPLRELVRQAHAGGIQVHPYLVMLHGGLSKHPAFQPDWFARDRRGELVGRWLNPAHPGVRSFLTQLVCEVALTGVDGIHYDYIRHEYDTDYDYSDFTRRRFAAECGFDPLTNGRPDPSRSGMRLLQTSYLRGEGLAYFNAQRSFFAAAGYRPTPVDEDDLDRLRRDTLLVCGNLYCRTVSPRTIAALLRFAEQGGAVLVLDGPEAAVDSPQLADAVGLRGRGQFDDSRVNLYFLGADHPVGAHLAGILETRGRGNPCPKVTSADVLAVFADGSPAVTVKRYGRGSFLVVNFLCYEDDAARDTGVQRLVSNAAEWLCQEHGIYNAARVVPAVANGPAVWEQWRIQQVTELVRECTEAARALRPELILSAAGGTQRSDLHEIKRDGLTWLHRGFVQYLCPMTYTTDNDLFRRRLRNELEPLDERRYEAVLFAGLGAYKLRDTPSRVAQQVTIAREMGLKGVCFFAFEDLDDALIDKLRSTVFPEPAELPWRMVPEAAAPMPGG
ncbi:MAG: family 10 glycosylhydrolase [Armatimonadetes bacterium]|nr:family 10 glycosylhydrolase [Armatimonadota bacterium]